MSKDVAIDLGSSNIRVYSPDKELMFNEPSVVTVDNYTGKIIAFGNDAYKMIGKTSDRVSLIYPVESGIISEFDITEQLVYEIMRKIYSNKVVMPRVVACIPGEMTEVEKRSVVNAVSMTGVRKVCLIENPISSAIGAGIDVATPEGSFVVDMGGGTVDMAVISLSGVSVIKTIKLGGKTIDGSIVKFVRNNHNLIIGSPTAENIKNSIGCAYPLPEELSYTVKGRDMISGLPNKCQVTSTEIYELCIETTEKIISAVCDVLEETPPELIGDIYNTGITLTGGLAKLKGIDKAISEATGLKTIIVEDPELCAVKGAGKSLKYINDMDDKEYGILNPLKANY